MKCNMTFESEEEIIEHNKWISDGIEHEIVKKFKEKEHKEGKKARKYLRKHRKREHEITNEESNEEEEKDEIRIMVCDLSNHPDRPADWSSQNNKSRLEPAEELEEINKKKDYEMTTEEGSKEEEIIEHEDNNEECDQCGRWICVCGNTNEFECVQCNMTFESEEEIIEHDGCECDRCGKWTCDRICLRTHKKREHEIECEQCNRILESEEEILDHKKWFCDGIS